MNETIDLYRYFDATRQAEFLYECVQQTVEKTLPEEVAYLERHDRMKSFIAGHFDMPEKLTENLIAFLRQGGGKLSKRLACKEFSRLTEKSWQCSKKNLLRYSANEVASSVWNRSYPERHIRLCPSLSTYFVRCYPF